MTHHGRGFTSFHHHMPRCVRTFRAKWVKGQVFDGQKLSDFKFRHCDIQISSAQSWDVTYTGTMGLGREISIGIFCGHRNSTHNENGKKNV